MLCGYTRFAFRSVDTVSSEIAEVTEKIFEINDMLNVREVIAEVMEKATEDPHSASTRLSEIYKYASELSVEMCELFTVLKMLREELGRILSEEGIVFGGI